MSVVLPDPTWPDRFDALRRELATALGPQAIEIEHIGSTSVPDLPAKPIIDIALRVRSISDPGAWTPALTAIGLVRYFQGPVTHPVFIRTRDDQREVIVHLFDDERWVTCHQRLFRDHLLENPTARTRYASLKRRLNDAGVYGRAYTAAKTGIVQELTNAERSRRGLPPVDVWDT